MTRTQSRIFAALALAAVIALGLAAPAAAGDAKAPRDSRAGMQVFIDPATGKMREATPEEMRMMSERLQAFLDRSSRGLRAQKSANGTIGLSLQGGFLNVWVATVGGNGTVANVCVNDYASAQAILSGQQQLSPVYEEK